MQGVFLLLLILWVSTEAIGQNVTWTRTQRYTDWSLWTHADPIEGTEDFFIASETVARNSIGQIIFYTRNIPSKAQLIVFCTGDVQVSLEGHRIAYGQSGRGWQDYTIRARWDSMATHKRKATINISAKFMTNAFVVLRAKTGPSLKKQMMDNNRLMLEVKLKDYPDEMLAYYTFSLRGFTKSNQARIDKGCEPMY